MRPSLLLGLGLLAPAAVRAQGRWRVAGIVRDVQRWVASPTSNFGWLQQSEEARAQSVKVFATREDARPALRPKLDVTYATTPASVRPLGRGCSGSGTSPIALAASGSPCCCSPSGLAAQVPPPWFHMVSMSQEYRDWCMAQIQSRYEPKDGPPYPWTRLGYTYDWGDPNSRVGMSEFVLRPRASVIVESKTPTEAFGQCGSKRP